MSVTDWQTAAGVLQISAQLVDGVQQGLAARGFGDVRPVHGFAFAAMSGRAVTTTELAAALSVSKQAAAQLVDHLVRCGYVTRRPDPRDGRALLLVLTGRGHACTAAAEAAAAEVVDGWRGRLPRTAFDGFLRTVTGIAEPGRLRPSW